MPKTPRKALPRRRKTYRQQAGATEAEAKATYEYTLAAINAHELKPNLLVNPNSKFVVVTYWWGRGRLNANMSRPCPDVFVEQIKEEIDDEEADTDPDYKAFRDKYLELKRRVTSPNANVTPALKAEWINTKTKYNLIRKRSYLKSKAKIDREILPRYKARPPYTGPDKNLEGTGGLSRQPVKLEEMIDRWEKACQAAGCNYLAQEYPEFTKEWPKYYQSAINAKPLFIKKALEACQGRTVLYIDGDMLVHKYPKIFDMQGVDFMAQGWVTDPRTNKRFATHQCFDPYIFETSGGTMAYSPTQTARKLLDDWANAAHELRNYGKAEDRVLSMIFTMQNMILPVNVVQLPIEYLWLTDKYANFSWNGAADIKDAFIEHPECLTAEEAAADQGAAVDRSPEGYVKEVTDRADCKRNGGDFYEYIFFSTPGMVDSMGPYLKFMKTVKNSQTNEFMFQVVDYEDKYGEYNAIALKNVDDAKHLNLNSPTEGFIVLPYTVTIPEILFYLHRGVDVHIGDKFDPPTPEIQACATNRGGRMRTRYLPEMKLDVKQPMFFSAKSRILAHLFRMCATLSDINTHLSFSYMFTSRIRWFLLQQGPRGAPMTVEQQLAAPPIVLPVVPPSTEELEMQAMKRLESRMEAEMNAPREVVDAGAVPKKVHQIWFGGELPPWRQYLFDLNKAAAERNGYTYKLWQNADRTPEFFQSTIGYQNGAIDHGQQTGQSRWAQVADLARMEILYKEGGVYLDSLFETGDDLYKEITRLSLEGKSFIGCNEDPCELECVGAEGKKYLSNSFFATMQWSPVLERLLKDEELGKIDLDSPAINQTTGPYYLRTGIVDPVADKVFLFKSEEIYPFPMSGSVQRPPEPNPFLLREVSENSIETTPGMWLQKGALQLLQSQGRPIKPLALYHVGLGGTWST
jgi:hypothetical protein